MKQAPNKTVVRLTLLLALIALGGCATTRYSCPAPNGVTCMSTTDIYEATNSREQISGSHAASPDSLDVRTRSHPTPTPVRSRRDVVIVRQGALSFDDVGSYPVGGIGHKPAISPVRTPPKVMRVWLSPWEDEGGDLHLASAVYTEIQPRRWSVGEPGGLSGPHLQLIQPLVGATPKAMRSSSPPLEPLNAPPVNPDSDGLN